MSDRLIPVDTQRAATRAFVRTFAQSLASAFPTGAVVVGITGDWWLSVALAVASALIGSLLAGGAAYLSILSKGIPGDYAPVVDGGTPRRAITPTV